MDVPTNITKKYIRIHTNRNYDPISNMEIAFSSTNPNPTRANAEFFHDQFAGNDVDLYLNSENITDDKFYISNTLSTEEAINNYNLSVTEVDYIEVGRDSRYTHSISPEKSFSLTPEVFRIPRFSHNKSEDEGAFLTVSASGSTLKDDILCFLTYHNKTGDQGVEIKMEKFNEGKIATFKENDYKYEDETAYYEMLCYGIPGDLIKIDAKSTTPAWTRK